jgi:hypothetical protein
MHAASGQTTAFWTALFLKERRRRLPPSGRAYAMLWRNNASSVLLIAPRPGQRQQVAAGGIFSGGKRLCPWQNFGIFGM